MEGEITDVAFRYMADIALADMTLGLIVIMATCLMVVFIINKITSIPQSIYYRRFLSNMFVAGKIRKYAEADKIDIAVEARAFELWNKKRGLEWERYDNVVEEEMKERIIQDMDKSGKKVVKKEDK